MFKKLGLQLYTVRDYMKDEKSIGETFERLVRMGYTEGQTAGACIELPFFADIAKKSGMTIIGTLYDFDKIVSDPEKTMALHDALGTKHIGIGSMPQAVRRDYDALMRFIETFNSAAEVYAEAGFKLDYHNHSFEFVKINGQKTVMDCLYEGFDPKNVSFVLDTCWVAHGGADVCRWIEKFADRIDILHLKDIEAFYDESGAITQSFTHIGNGNIHWEGVLSAAEKIGVQHYVVEQDARFIDNDPFKALAESRDYLAHFMK